MNKNRNDNKFGETRGKAEATWRAMAETSWLNDGQYEEFILPPGDGGRPI